MGTPQDDEAAKREAFAALLKAEMGYTDNPDDELPPLPPREAKTELLSDDEELGACIVHGDDCPRRKDFKCDTCGSTELAKLASQGVAMGLVGCKRCWESVESDLTHSYAVYGDERVDSDAYYMAGMLEFTNEGETAKRLIEAFEARCPSSAYVSAIKHRVFILHRLNEMKKLEEFMEMVKRSEAVELTPEKWGKLLEFLKGMEGDSNAGV